MRLSQTMRSVSGTLAAVGPTNVMYMEYSANDKPGIDCLGFAAPGAYRHVTCGVLAM
jgi:hypothetical protein